MHWINLEIFLLIFSFCSKYNIADSGYGYPSMSYGYNSGSYGGGYENIYGGNYGGAYSYKKKIYGYGGLPYYD